MYAFCTLHVPDEAYFRSCTSETKSLCTIPRPKAAILDWYGHVLISNGCANMQNVGGMLPQIVRCSENCFCTSHVWGIEVLRIRMVYPVPNDNYCVCSMYSVTAVLNVY